MIANRPHRPGCELAAADAGKGRMPFDCAERAFGCNTGAQSRKMWNLAGCEAKFAFNRSASADLNFEVAPKVVFAFCEAAELFAHSVVRWTFGDEA